MKPGSSININIISSSININKSININIISSSINNSINKQINSSSIKNNTPNALLVFKRPIALCVFVNGELALGFLELSLSFYGRPNISDRFTFHFIRIQIFQIDFPLILYL